MCYLNPIDGSFTTYKNPDHFPHQPRNVIHLDEIINVQHDTKAKLYHQENIHYLKIEAKNTTYVLFDGDLNMVKFLCEQICIGRQYYNWVQSLIKLRYSSTARSTKSSITTADIIINKILSVQIPLIDLDSYREEFPSDAALKIS